MKICFSQTAWQQYTSWEDRRVRRRIHLLIQDILRNGDSGLGKPELLKGPLSGLASRRINEEHRLVYRLRDDHLEIHSCRFHYDT